MDLETVLRAIESAAKPGGGMNRDPGAVLLHDLRHALGERAVGLAGERPPPVRLLHGRRTARTSPARRRSSARTRPKCEKGRSRGCASRRPSRMPAARSSPRSTSRSARRHHRGRRARTTSSRRPRRRSIRCRRSASLASAMTARAARAADEADRRLHLADDARTSPRERLAQIKKAGVEKIGFAWAGPIEPGQKHYYRVQGPTFLIEFDNTQNNGNHIHSVWRDFAGRLRPRPAAGAPLGGAALAARAE